MKNSKTFYSHKYCVRADDDSCWQQETGEEERKKGKTKEIYLYSYGFRFVSLL